MLQCTTISGRKLKKGNYKKKFTVNKIYFGKNILRYSFPDGITKIGDLINTATSTVLIMALSREMKIINRKKAW